ncbi:hypothetical protein TRFO_03503 [Tritrichomonas foetus]|uniref:Uncharacterized protein n=1 Tax=Tritrichomonas foetus TaxID=1144522 RepID=A0A1J4KP52_9EUKA|nr:hypothetical protein TRFO_03503 [Tritrichomonas foetus]|eukprot:OHT13073.1 hypothetical protein TRFO_03503 [Tritrichomonas foetus]
MTARSAENIQMPVYDRLFKDSRRNSNPRFSRYKKINRRRDEIEWRKRLESQELTVSSTKGYCGVPTQKKITSPRLRVRRNEDPHSFNSMSTFNSSHSTGSFNSLDPMSFNRRARSERLPRWNEIRHVNEADKTDIRNMSTPLKRFPLPPIDYNALYNIFDKPRSQYLVLADLKLGF